MKKILFFLLVFAVFIFGIFADNLFANQEWIVDILSNPSRYWNRTVTVVGQVQTVTANPAGTTRGTYTLLDESCPNPIAIRTNELPPVGKIYSITGVVTPDPAQVNVPILREEKRASPGLPSLTKYLLIGGGILFLVLLIIFITLLTKPKEKATAPETIRPSVSPGSAVSGLDKTTRIPQAPSAPAQSADKTQVFISLGAMITVDRGPDQGKEFTLHKQVTTIGRPGSRKNDIELADDTVSKEQSSIFYDNAQKQFSLTNESTTNPTKVNTQLITHPHKLNHDDRIEIGRTVLRFIIE